MRIKRYLLLAPIIFAALLAVLAAGYFYEEDRALAELQSAQKEQALLRDTMLALVNEQSQSVKYIFEKRIKNVILHFKNLIRYNDNS